MGEGPALVQVVLNLVVNAANAITSGTAAENTILLKVSSKGDQAVLVVKDTGHGIPYEQQEKIFDPLFTTRAEEGGTGMGLSIVSRVVSRLGGDIDLESAPGQGACFTVHLPRHTS